MGRLHGILIPEVEVLLMMAWEDCYPSQGLTESSFPHGFSIREHYPHLILTEIVDGKEYEIAIPEGV